VDFLIERAIKEILRFHRYDYFLRAIRYSPCPALDGPGIVVYDPEHTEGLSLQVGPASEFYCDPFEAKQLEIIRRDLPLFLRWYWVERFYLERDWYLPNPDHWQEYQRQMIDKCLGPNRDDDDLECDIYFDDDCPCAMGKSRFTD
jgi:hypothetical protein